MSEARDRITKACKTVDQPISMVDVAVLDGGQIDPRDLYTPLYDLKFALAFIDGWVAED